MQDDDLDVVQVLERLDVARTEAKLVHALVPPRAGFDINEARNLVVTFVRIPRPPRPVPVNE